MSKQLRFNGKISAKAADGKPRRLSIMGYGGGLMSVSGMGPIVVDLAGLEMPNSVTVLRDHENAIAGVVGSASPQVVNNQLLFDAKCADTESARDVISILESGVELQASIGAQELESRRVDAGDTITVNGRSIEAGDRGFTLVTRSALREITIVPCGADSSTSVSLAAKLAATKGSTKMNVKAMLKATMKFSDDEVDAMTEQEAKAALKKCMSDADPDPKDKDSEPAEAAALIEIFGDHSDRGVIIQAAREKWTVGECKRESLRQLRAARPGAGVGVRAGDNRHSIGSNGYNSGDDMAPFVAAMLSRCGLEKFAEKTYGGQVLEASRPMQRLSISGMMSAYLSTNGIAHDRDDVDGMIRASGGSTISVPSLLANTLGKVLEAQWIAAPATWRSWCLPKVAKDLKIQSSVRPSFVGTLTQLAPSGEIQHASIADANIPWQVFTFAKMLTVGRQLLINDDLSAFTEIPGAFAAMSERALSDLVYATLMADAGTNFSSGNSNDQSGGPSALSAASLTVAVKQLRKQVAPNGSPLNMPPATLIVPPSLEQTAREILNSDWIARDHTADRQPMGNPFFGLANLEVEARLELGCTSPIKGSTLQAGSTTRWYLSSTPDRLPAIIGFLRTGGGPEIMTAGPDYNFDTPGMSVRCILDAGFALGDFRAMQRSAGA